MMIFKISQCFVTSVLVLGLLSYHCCNAETTSCDGTITETIIGDVECANDCVLYNATVTGNVTCMMGSLVAKGDSSIAGNVLVSGSATRITLVDVTVLGDVEVINATSLTEVVIKQAATVNGSVSVQNTPGNIYVSGSIANLVLVDSGNLFAYRLTTTNALGADHGISVLGGNGVVKIRGSRVEGGLSVQQHDGDIKIDGTIFIRGTNPDFIVVNHAGDVKLVRAQVDGVNMTKVQGYVVLYSVRIESDMNINEVTGNLLLKQLNVNGNFPRITIINGTIVMKDSNFNVDRGPEISNVTGNVAVEDINFQVMVDLLIFNINGDVSIKDSNFQVSQRIVGIQFVSGNVAVKDSNFNAVLVLISRVDGNVIVFCNYFFIIDIEVVSGYLLFLDSIVGNELTLNMVSGPVKIVDNDLATTIVSKNTGKVVITRNIIETLTCDENVRRPFVSDTNKIGSSSGQC